METLERNVGDAICPLCINSIIIHDPNSIIIYILGLYQCVGFCTCVRTVSHPTTIVIDKLALQDKWEPRKIFP